MNNVVLIGRLTKDPVLKYLPTGDNTAVARFTLAVDKQLSKDKKAEMEASNKPTADFINCVAWGKLAETVANWTSKGDKVGVLGKIETGSYEAEDGTKRYTTEVRINNVEFLKSNNSPVSTTEDEGLYTINNEDIPF